MGQTIALIHSVLFVYLHIYTKVESLIWGYKLVVCLQRGMYCLCELHFPRNFGSALRLSAVDGGNLESLVTNQQIIGLCDPVQGRVNIVTSTGQVLILAPMSSF